MKVFNRLAVLMILLVSVVSCSSESNTITLSHHFLHHQSEILDKIIQKFAKLHPEIKIKASYENFQDLESSWNSRTYQELKKTPDLMILPHDRIGSLVEWKVLRPIDDVMAAHRKEFHAKALEAVRYLDHYYAVPLSMESLLLFYRKDRISKAPKTLQELFIQTERFTGRDKLVFPGMIPYFALPWIFAYGGSLYSPIGTVELNHPGNISAIQHYKNFLKLAGGSVQSEKEAYQSFVSGVAPFFISGQWSIETLLADKVPFGVSTLPEISKGHPVQPFLGVQAIAVNQTISKKKYDNIKLFLEFLIDKKFSNDLSISSKYLSPLKEDLKNYEDPILLVGREQLKHTILMNNHPDMVKIWQSLSPKIMTRLLNSEDPKFLLDTLQKELQNQK